MPNYSGVWSLPTQMQAEAQGNWPSPPTIPFAFFALAYDSGGTGINVINRLALSTTGNATDFGDSTATTDGRGGAASVTRGLFTVGGNTNTIEYITFGTSGNASDFGDASTNGYYMMGASNSTRAIFGQYLDANYGYVTIASTGNTTTFGTTSASQNAYSGTSVCSSTRAVFCGNGDIASYGNVMEYVTIATIGNAVDFGDLTVAVGAVCTGIASSSTRGIVAGGETTGAARSNHIQYLTIATTGNATDFGDLTQTSSKGMAASSTVKCVFSLGSTASGVLNTIDQVTTATTGNATDFGDLTQAAYTGAGTSNAHGGLS